MSEKDLPEPPQLPDAPRHVRVYRYQWVGLVVLTVFPLLAALDVFGEHWTVERMDGVSLEATVRYPDRYRYKQLNSVTVQLTNTSGVTLDTVRVQLDTALANRFSTVTSTPSFDEPYSVPLTGVAPGETRWVVIELQGEEYGRHEGELRIVGGDTLRLPLSIRIFP